MAVKVKMRLVNDFGFTCNIGSAVVSFSTYLNMKNWEDLYEKARSGLYIRLHWLTFIDTPDKIKSVVSSFYSRNSARSLSEQYIVCELEKLEKDGENEKRVFRFNIDNPSLMDFVPKISERRIVEITERGGQYRAAVVSVEFVDDRIFFAKKDREDSYRAIFSECLNMPLPNKLGDKTYKEVADEIKSEKELLAFGLPEDVDPVVLNTWDISTLNGVVQESLGLNYGDEMPLSVFIREYKNKMLENVQKNLNPVFSPERDLEKLQEYAKKLSKLKKKPLPGQVQHITAIVEGLKHGESKGLFVVGEMGVGKTYITASSAMLYGAKRVLVLCPTHLIEKWEREIKEIKPDAKVIQLNRLSPKELIQLCKTKPESGDTEFWILGKEKAKLTYTEKFSATEVVLPNDEKEYRCPRCGAIVDYKKRKCEACGEKLYAATNKIKRIAYATLIKKYLSVPFDIFIADEVHELKGGHTAQGQALASIAAVSKKVLAATGTLMGGYASDLFYLLWRVSPSLMLKLGIEYSTSGLKRFIERYGVLEKITIEPHEHKESIGSKKKVRTKEKPGISPELISELLGVSVFIKLNDIASGLPPYNEEVVMVDMTTEQAEKYNSLAEELRKQVRVSMKKGAYGALGRMINTLYSYPDAARRGGIVENGKEEIVLSVSPVSEDVLPKEEKLLEIVQEEVAQGRKVLVYLQYTGTKDITPEIRSILQDAGFSVAVLYSNTVKPEKRERWIKENTKDADVLIVNPRLLQTGLDLYDFPTIVFFQTGYSVFTLRQAARRSWRIGQKQPVKVYFLAYKNTIQEDAIRLMASKIETSLSVEGDISDRGLAALSDSESSIIIEMARNLISDSEQKKKEKEKKKKSLEEIWKSVLESEKNSERFLDSNNEDASSSGSGLPGYEIIGSVSIAQDKTAILTLNGNTYTLKQGKIFLGNSVSGRYQWRKSKKGTVYAVCVIKNEKFFIGRLNGEWVALRKTKTAQAVA